MSMLEAGQVFGRFTIINYVSGTETIETYRAYDSVVARDVTLKVFTRAASADRGLNERFQRAVVALLDLAHPNILDIHDAGEIDGLLYLAMPLVEGESLAQRAARGNLSPDDVDRIVRQAGDALEYAHAHGIAHGELSLDDVLLDARGNVQLGDFGIGTALSADPAGAIRQRDVALLGALALSLLAGRKLVEREVPSAEAVRPWLERLPPALRDAARVRIEQFMGRALSPKAAERFNTVADFLSAWARVRGEPAPVQPPAAQPITPGEDPASKLQAARIADAAALVQARTREYERERRERDSAAAHGEADARARTQRQTDERAASIRRAQERHDATFNVPKSPVAPALDPTAREAYSRLLRVINLVAAQRANSVGVPTGPIGRTVAFGDLTPAGAREVRAAVPQPPRAESTTSPARGLTQPRVDLALESERLRRQARSAAATALPKTGISVRSLVFGILVAIFVLVCVFPTVCFSLLLAIPDGSGTTTPVPTARRQAAIASPTPPPVATAAAPKTAAPTATPRRTNTPVVRPAPTQTAPVAPGVLVFTDTFALGACRLPEGYTDAGSFLCADGNYSILARTGAQIVQTYPAPWADVSIEADVRPITGSDSMAYGIVWRADSNRFYGFTVDPGGFLAVFESNNGELKYRIKGLNFSAVAKGRATNRLRVTTVGERLTFAVNGLDVPFSFSEPQPPAGRIGFIVISQAGDAQVAFSRLSVWDLRPQTPVPGTPLPLPTR